LSWQRYHHARRELRRQRIAEARISAMLAQNRELAQENLRILDLEHKRLARELHDELGQYVNAIKLDAVTIQESAGDDPTLCLQGAQSVVRAADHIHRAVTDMIGRLRPVGLDELGLVAAIEHCVDQWRQRLPHTRFQLTASGALDDLAEPLNLTAYRLIQEGLTNIYKHAEARNVRIDLERIHASATEPDELRLTVSDDGRGMQPTAAAARFGLMGMRERVQMVGGTFDLQSSPNHGVRFEARLPAASSS
jgi:glucose-6-phosphate-specific signal transduction histidine kinase